jgi:predicted TIM-barrel fold metal-dependent hydrolase
MTVNIIDPHIHLFDRSRGDYHWLKSENPPFWPDKSIIQRNFGIEDINVQLNNSDELANEIKLSGFVHIEAGFDNNKPWRELEYLESLSIGDLPLDSLSNEKSSSKPFRTIASVNLLAPAKDFKLTLKKLQNHPSLIGVRHILDDDAFDILSNQQAQHNFSYLNEIKDFIFELQLPLAEESSNKVMPLIKQIIAKNSQLRFIINHSGFPAKGGPKESNNTAWGLWKTNIIELAQYNNVFIKCSGMEMVDRQYEMSWFSQVTSYCISQFSIDRVMIASNFPLCLLGKEAGKETGKNNYGNYWQDILESSVIEQCSENEKSALLYDNALRIYKLSN